MRLHIKIPPPSLKLALEVLDKEGFKNIGLNESSLSIEVNSNERITPLRTLLLAEIPIGDFSIEEPSMEKIMAEVQGNGL